MTKQQWRQAHLVLESQLFCLNTLPLNEFTWELAHTCPSYPLLCNKPPQTLAYNRVRLSLVVLWVNWASLSGPHMGLPGGNQNTAAEAVVT